MRIWNFGSALTLGLLFFGAVGKSEASSPADYCHTTYEGEFMCVHHVRAPRNQPHLKTIWFSKNGGGVVRMSVNCWQNNSHYSSMVSKVCTGWTH